MDQRISGAFHCPRCDTLTVRWADLRNTTCGACHEPPRRTLRHRCRPRLAAL